MHSFCPIEEITIEDISEQLGISMDTAHNIELISELSVLFKQTYFKEKILPIYVVHSISFQTILYRHLKLS